MHRADVSEVVNACVCGARRIDFPFCLSNGGLQKTYYRLWISSMETDAIQRGLCTSEERARVSHAL